jgi:MoaA/NifB/PqqE/SkfB family radical SAM enzyme
MLGRFFHALTSPYATLKLMSRFKKKSIEYNLGHSKVIGWKNGPVYSLFLPPTRSNLWIDSMARFYNSLRTGYSTPIYCNIAVTNDCNMDCKHCYAHGQEGRELNTEEWKRIIKMCEDMGIFVFIITGGEPLVRKDIVDIIGAIDKSKMIPILYTNGYVLKEKAKQLKEAGLERILVSIDFADPERHDSHRKQSGSFQRAVEGIREAQKNKMLTAISTFASKERLENGVLEEILELGKSLKVNEVSVFDEMPVGKYCDKVDIEPVGSMYYQRLSEFINLHQKKYKKMGIWSYQQFRSSQSCGCPSGKTMFKVKFNGDLCLCEFCDTSVGNLLDASLEYLYPKLVKVADSERGSCGNCFVLPGSEHD